MLSRPHLAQRHVNYQTSNLLWFERNQTKDHKNTAKKPKLCNNYEIKNLYIKCHSSQTNHSEQSTENWYMDVVINFEGSFSGLEELSFNPVNYRAKTNYLYIKLKSYLSVCLSVYTPLTSNNYLTNQCTYWSSLSAKWSACHPRITLFLNEVSNCHGSSDVDKNLLKFLLLTTCKPQVMLFQLKLAFL